MIYNELGKTGITISRAGYGCRGIGKSFLADKPQKIDEVIETAIDHGITFFDLADVYCNGDSEEIIGRQLQGRRERFILATKGGKITPTLSKIANRLIPLAPLIRPLLGHRGKKIQKSVSRKNNFDPGYLKTQLDGSLRRLKTDYVDCYFLHCPTLEEMKDHNIYKWMQEEKKSGRIRAFGLSVYTPDEAIWALDHQEIDILQIPYHLLQREAEQSLFKHKLIDQVGIVARAPLALGELTPKNAVNHPEIIAAATEAGVTVTEYAIQFVNKNPHVDNVLFGATKKENLLSNLGVFK